MKDVFFLTMEERKGKKVRMILDGDLYYSGTIKHEDDFFIVIYDKFGKTVQISKRTIKTLEEL